MEKTSYLKFLKISERRRKKREKRKRKNPQHKDHWSIELEFHRSVDMLKIANFNNDLIRYLLNFGFLSYQEPLKAIKIPENFCLESNYIQVVKTLQAFSSAVFNAVGREVVVDFSNCKKIDISALFLLQVLRIEFGNILNKLQSKLRVLNVVPSFQVIPSSEQEVIKSLFLANLLKEVEVANSGLIPKSQLGYITGKKTNKHYSDNNKGIKVTGAVSFVNSCLNEHGYELNAEGKNELEGLMSEILGNAEDHSPFKTFYMNAFFSKEMSEINDSERTGELNLVILNFGNSIYQGLEDCKENNELQHEMLEQYFQKVLPQMDKNITREDIFTLYSLQEGVSRLKFEDESRGTGTMKFINSFFAFGDFEDENRQYFPKMVLFSGHTQIILDNSYKPFEREQNFCISLNPEQSLDFPPRSSHLKNHSIPFPGTLFSVRVYINHEHLRRKYGTN